MTTTAYVLAVPGSWDWVGSRPLLGWLTRKLATVRGVDRVVVLSRQGQGPETFIDDVPVVNVSHDVQPGWDGIKSVASAVAAEGSDVNVFVHGGYCCLDPGSVERAISAVINEGQSAAIGVRSFGDAVVATGPRRRVAVVVEMPALLVARRDVDAAAAVPAYVELEEREVLDATTAHGAALARAMAEQGDF